MALSGDTEPKDDEFCRGIRRDIIEVGAAKNDANATIRKIKEAIADAVNLLVQTRTELGTTTDPHSRRRLRSKVQRVERIRDQFRQKLNEQSSILNELTSQLKQFQLIAASRGC